MHDPSLFYDSATGKYYSYCTDAYPPPQGQEEEIGIPVRSSPDMVRFTYEGVALSAAAIARGQDNGDYPPTKSFWAPYVECVAGEYRMYYSATREFGSPESRIWLAVSDNPLGPFENRGIVADTWGMGEASPNAIDPHIVWENGRCWLVYGSFFGGIYLKELDPESGLPPDGDCRRLGTRISRKGAWDSPDGPEGAAVAYAPEEGYFYLFQSYGWLGDTYDIRVGRSRTVTGVYTDRNGRSLDGQSPGEKIAGSYCFHAGNPSVGNDCPDWTWGGFRAPGHGAPFFDPVRKAWFFAHHVRDGAATNRSRSAFDGRVSYRRHYGMIRPMFFKDGWPLLGAEPFAGESLDPVTVKAEADWKLIFLDDSSNDMKYSLTRRLSPDDPLLTRGIVHPRTDYENGKPSLALTGTDRFGIAYWGKLLYNGSITDLCKTPEERSYVAYQKSG